MVPLSKDLFETKCLVAGRPPKTTKKAPSSCQLHRMDVCMYALISIDGLYVYNVNVCGEKYLSMYVCIHMYLQIYYGVYVNVYAEMYVRMYARINVCMYAHD
jgi:hypothetical protein